MHSKAPTTPGRAAKKMVHLPNEIIANIISHVAAQNSSSNYLGYDIGSDGPPAHPLAPYATVSRGWQQCVEARTFASVMLTPARLASPLAAQALTPGRVRRFVRSVLVDVLLPPYGEEARARREDEDDRARNDAVFTEVVRGVFALLAGAKADLDVGHGAGDEGQQQRQQSAGYRPKIGLFLQARCVSDGEDWEARMRRRGASPFPYNDLFRARYESSYLDLRPAAGRSVEDEVAALPELHCIQVFFVRPIRGPWPYRSFAPRAACLLASRMPGLERVDWEFSDNEKRDAALRKKLREDFAHALQTLPSSLRHFDLDYERSPPLDHSYQTPSLLDDTDGGNDKLSLALHKLSQHLATFHLLADVGPEIFWPLERTAPGHHHHQQEQQQQQQHQDNDPLWPIMREYMITPGFIAPSGEWRWQRNPDSDLDSDDGAGSFFSEDLTDVLPGNEREDPFRTQLVPDAAHELLLASARAARRMPALWNMWLMLMPPIGAVQRVEAEYTVMARAARRDRALTRPVGGTAELVFGSVPAFPLDEEVVQAWRRAAEEHTGAESGLVVVIKGLP
jgi:hypothetical protein